MRRQGLQSEQRVGVHLCLHLLAVLLKLIPELLPVLPEVRVLPLSHQQQERQDDRHSSQNKGANQPCQNSPYHPADPQGFFKSWMLPMSAPLTCWETRRHLEMALMSPDGCNGQPLTGSCCYHMLLDAALRNMVPKWHALGL